VRLALGGSVPGSGRDIDVAGGQSDNAGVGYPRALASSPASASRRRAIPEPVLVIEPGSPTLPTAQAMASAPASLRACAAKRSASSPRPARGGASGCASGRGGSSRANSSASLRSVFTRSPEARGVLLGATTCMLRSVLFAARRSASRSPRRAWSARGHPNQPMSSCHSWPDPAPVVINRGHSV
jgi:hypothetical protein